LTIFGKYIILETNLEDIFMRKFNERNLNVQSDQIVIRSIRKSDLSFYKDWYKIRHIKKDSLNSVTEDDIETWINNDSNNFYLFIIEIDNNPIGEISIWDDTSLILLNKTYKKPFFNIEMRFYQDIAKNTIDKILRIFIEFITTLKFKIKSLYTFVEELDNYEDIYLKNGFDVLDNNFIKSKTEKFFTKNNIENPYTIRKMLFKNV
jgi:hypothetical protein